MTRQSITKRRRRAFTLVEMLVVIAIMGVLLGLTVFFFPSFSQRKRASNGASQLQGWLYQAKYRAYRDGKPRGLRLIQDPGAPTKVRECQFVEVPDDFTGGTLETAASTATVVILKNVNITQGYGDAEKNYWLIQAGDILEIQGLGLPHRITDVAVDGKTGYVLLSLASPVPYPILSPGTPHYRVMPAPRLVEEPFKLPDDVIIDLATNGAHGYPLPPGIDILFTPSGKLINAGVARDFIPLWVRDETFPTPFEGNPSITAIHVRSGLVATHPPATTGNPYQYVIDGRTPE